MLYKNKKSIQILRFVQTDLEKCSRIGLGKEVIRMNENAIIQHFDNVFNTNVKKQEEQVFLFGYLLAKEFDIDPAILATIIFTEQYYNVDMKDDYIDPLASAFLDVSLGVCQIRISTAMKIENAGYMNKTQNGPWYVVGGSRWRRIQIISKLMNTNYRNNFFTTIIT